MTSLTRIFSSKAQTKLIQYLLEHRGKVFHQAGLSRLLSISPSTVARIIEPLITERIIAYEKVGDQMKVIALNDEEERVKVLIDFYEKMRRL